MLELLFSDSGAAQLAFAKETGDLSHISSMSCTNDRQGNETFESVEPLPYTGPKVPGDTSDILPFYMMADMGDLQNFWESRLAMTCHMVHLYGDSQEDMKQWKEQEQGRIKQAEKRLSAAATAGDPIRIWWSDTPSETCGYYWAMHQLQNSTGPVFSINIPRVQSQKNDRFFFTETGQLEPEGFYHALPLTREVSLSQRIAGSALWMQLVSENAPLRTVMNGVPYSVPADYYDWLLRKFMPEGSFQVIELLGRTLGQGPGGIDLFWLAGRLQTLIETGELKIRKKHDKFFYITLSRNN